uniref:Ovule protein n=1 Tax=Heterorhabditis bacteriophora TaxID=37862 RepID=A0A1I7W6W1_HETBA
MIGLYCLSQHSGLDESYVDRTAVRSNLRRRPLVFSKNPLIDNSSNVRSDQGLGYSTSRMVFCCARILVSFHSLLNSYSRDPKLLTNGNILLSLLVEVGDGSED